MGNILRHQIHGGGFQRGHASGTRTAWNQGHHRGTRTIPTDFLDDSSLGRTKTVIADYSATAGAAREWADNSHNAQPGDPAKAAAAMVKITQVERPPLRL